MLYSRRPLTGSYFGGAPGGCWSRSSYRPDQPIAPTIRPRYTRHADDPKELPVNKVAASRTFLRPPANHRDASRFPSKGRPRSLVCELRFYVNFIFVRYLYQIQVKSYVRNNLESIYFCIAYFFNIYELNMIYHIYD